jgi:two-component system, NarL family, nitrate/nitrite response regulator NarL
VGSGCGDPTAGGRVPDDLPSVLLVDDHCVLADAMAMALRLQGFTEVEQVRPDGDGGDVLAAVERHGPEVVLLDLNLGGERSALPLIRPLVDRGSCVLVLTASDDRSQLARCLEEGAAGVFDKAIPLEDLVAHIRDAALGRAVLRPEARDALLSALREERAEQDHRLGPFRRLTAREAEVLAALCRGMTAEVIATEQFVSVGTVRSHIKSILSKLGVNSQLAAAALARHAGWDQAGGGSRHH